MAKKATDPVAPSAPAPADQAVPKKVGRPAGFSTKDGDVFTACDPQPKDKKVAPQAQQIVNLVIAAGPKGLSRKTLVEKMDGVVETRQPQGRILSYYQKLLIESGFLTLTADTAPAPATPAEA